MMIMGFRNTEGWLLFQPSEIPKEEELPKNSDLQNKSHSARLRGVLYILFKKASENGKFVGAWESYYSERMEKIIQQLKDKIDDV